MNKKRGDIGMILSMTGQAWLFLLTSALGFLAGLLFDIFRILRRTFKHPDFLTHIEDLFYWLAVTVIMFYFMLNNNNGEIRVFPIIGIFLGMVIYFMSLSIVVFNVSVAVINFIKKVIRLIIRIITAPFKLLAKIIRIPIKAIAGFISPILFKASNRTKRGLKKTLRYAKIKLTGVKKDFGIIIRKI